MEYTDEEIDDINTLISDVVIKEKDLMTDDEIKYYESLKEKRILPAKIYINQSLVKYLTDQYGNTREYCPRYMFDYYLVKTIDGQSDSMIAGQFFETLCLGESTKGKIVKDLPRKLVSAKKKAELIAKNLPVIGEKTVDQIRIEAQAERFKVLAEQCQLKLIQGINTHKTIIKDIGDKRFFLRGETDIFPTTLVYEGESRLAIVDLKLTQDINSTFGDFCWGSAKYMDMIQGDFYLNLVKDLDLELNPHFKQIPKIETMIDIINQEDCIFLYWVFGIKGPLEDRKIERLYRDPSNPSIRQQELKERIRKTISIIEMEEINNFPESPSTDKCKNCPNSKRLGGNCKSSNVIEKY